jgi:hypothetical protein
VFRGNGSSGWWFYARLPAKDPGRDTNLRFYYLQVERYSTGGLAINGGLRRNGLGLRVPSTVGANRNTVLGMTFRQMGSRHAPGGIGYGGVDLVNSSDNLIRHNNFREQENRGADAELMHGVYLAHWSRRNQVVNNAFTDVSGGAIHTRNDSNGNTMTGNTFTRTGGVSAYYDWYCDSDCVAEDPDRSRECPSHGNVFRDNRLVSAYGGGNLAAYATKLPDSSGGRGCDSQGQPRVRASGNKR